MFRKNGSKGLAFTVAVPAAAAALVLVLSGCSTGTSGSGDAGDSASVAAVIKGLDNAFFQTMQSGIETQAKTDGVDVTVQAAAGADDTTGQADKLTSLAGQAYGCFIVNPISGTNLIQALAPVSAAGKTIVNIDSPLDAAAAKAADIKVNTYIGTDNKAAGGKGGTFVASKIAAGSKVAIIGGVAGNETSAARIDGFKAALGSAGTVVQEIAADWNREKALTAATDIIAANPDVAAFFAANDDMGLGIVKAVENAGKTGQIVVVSVDGNQDALESVKAGGLSATIAQYPFAVGSLGIQACQVAAAGKTLPANVESPTALVTQDKADAAIKAFPQPFETFDNPLADLLK
jgi:ABC-type sugar transport system substrate-binding protein